MYVAQWRRSTRKKLNPVALWENPGALWGKLASVQRYRCIWELYYACNCILRFDDQDNGYFEVCKDKVHESNAAVMVVAFVFT